MEEVLTFVTLIKNYLINKNFSDKGFALSAPKAIPWVEKFKKRWQIKKTIKRKLRRNLKKRSTIVVVR